MKIELIKSITIKSTLLAALAFSPLASAATWYADPAGTAANSGTSAADATSIDLALSRSASGDTVIAAAGTYGLAANLSLSTDITLQGAGAGVTIIDGSAIGGGGIIQVSSAGTTSITDITFSGNSLGQGVNILSGTVNFDRTEFLKNGIGVYFNGASAAGSVNASYFDSNVDMGIYATGSNITAVTKSIFTNNTGTYGAVFLYANTPLVQVMGNTFISNSVGLDIRDNAGVGNLVNATGNSFNDNEWGIYIDADATTRATISRNVVANSSQYGIVISGAQDYSRVERNKVTGGNAGIVIDNGAQSTVINNLVTTNSLYGISSGASAALIAFNTVAANGTDGIYAVNADASTYLNNISYGNGSYGFNIDASSSAVEIGYSDTYGNTAGDINGAYVNLGGNVLVDPLFVSATNYRLTSTSPVIDASGIYWIRNDHTGYGRSNPADMGAYEYHK